MFKGWWWGIREVEVIDKKIPHEVAGRLGVHRVLGTPFFNMSKRVGALPVLSRDFIGQVSDRQRRK